MRRLGGVGVEELVTCQLHSLPVAFGDFARLSCKPEKPLEGHNQEEARREDT
jgi:hypothetical protein